MEHSHRRRRVSPALSMVVIGMLLAGISLMPSFAAPSTKSLSKKVKKISKRLTKVEGALTEVEGAVAGLPHTETFSLSKTREEPETPLGTWGPFSLVFRCDGISAGAMIARVEIRTAAADSTFGGAVVQAADFDPSDSNGPIFWATQDGDVPGGATETDSATDGIGFAMAPDGTRIEGHMGLSTNLGGHDCVLAGVLTQIA